MQKLAIASTRCGARKGAVSFPPASPASPSASGMSPRRATFTNAGIARRSLEVERPPAGEPTLHRVPVADRVLAALPAQEDDAAAPLRVEVDQALVEVAEHHAHVGEARQLGLD